MQVTLCGWHHNWIQSHLPDISIQSDMKYNGDLNQRPLDLQLKALTAELSPRQLQPNLPFFNPPPHSSSFVATQTPNTGRLLQ